MITNFLLSTYILGTIYQKIFRSSQIESYHNTQLLKNYVEVPSEKICGKAPAASALGRRKKLAPEKCFSRARRAQRLHFYMTFIAICCSTWPFFIGFLARKKESSGAKSSSKCQSRPKWQATGSRAPLPLRVPARQLLKRRRARRPCIE